MKCQSKLFFFFKWIHVTVKPKMHILVLWQSCICGLLLSCVSPFIYSFNKHHNVGAMCQHSPCHYGAYFQS